MRQPVDTVADADDHAGHLAAGHVGRRSLELVLVLEHQRVGEGDGGGLDLDQELPGPGSRVGRLLDHQVLGWTERVADDGSHGLVRSPSWLGLVAPDADECRDRTRTGPDATPDPGRRHTVEWVPPPSPATRRLFVAVRPSAAVAAELFDLTRTISAEIDPDVRWSRPEDYHVTLRYIGAAPTDAVERSIDGALPSDAVTVDLGPGLIELGSAIVAPAAGADELAGRITGALDGVVPNRPDRPFLGHLTIARWRRRGRHCDGVLGRQVGGQFTASTLELLASVRSRGSDESHYETICTWPLLAR